MHVPSSLIESLRRQGMILDQNPNVTATFDAQDWHSMSAREGSDGIYCPQMDDLFFISLQA